MADISEILSKEAIDGILKADRALNDLDATIVKVINNAQSMNSAITGGGMKEYQQAVKQVSATAKELNAVNKQTLATERELAKEQKKLAEQTAKEAARIKERNDALKLTVKSIEDATRQNKALRETVKQLDLTTKEGRASLKQYNDQINQNSKFIRENSDAEKQRTSGIGKYTQSILKAGAALGITVGAGKVFQAFLESTDFLSDKVAESLGGINGGLKYVASSLATLDFNNFLTGLNEAIKAGREYVTTLDQINDRTRALGIIEAKDRERLADLQIILRDVTRTEQERIAAGKEILNIEQKNSERGKQLAKDKLDNELKYASSQTKLSKDRVAQLLEEAETNKDVVNQAQAYNKALEAQRIANVGASGATMYGQSATPTALSKENQKILKETPQSIKQYAAELTALSKLNEEDYNRIADAIKGVGEANADFSETTARTQSRMAKLNKGILDDEEKKAAQEKKNIEQKKTDFELLTDKISKLKEQISVAILKTGQAPQGLMRELLGSEAELKRVQEQVDDILNGIQKVASKGYKTVTDPFTGKTTIQDIATGGANTSILQPRTATGGTAASGAAGTNPFLTNDEIRNLSLEGAQTTSDAIFQIVANADQAAFDHKMSLLDKEKEKKLKNANLTEKQKAKIEEDYQKKVAKLKEEQFRKEKAASIIQAIINTALAVTKAAPDVASMIAAGIAGAASIAVIAAQPVPQFDAGTDYTPANFIAGERRPEWMISPDGNVQLITRPTMFKNMAGSTVIGGAETERLMKAGLTPTNDIRPDIRRMEENVVRAIKEKKELSISASGSTITEREGDYYKTYFNKTVRWAGRKN